VSRWMNLGVVVAVLAVYAHPVHAELSAERTMGSRLTSVTVYPDRVSLHRECRQFLSAGRHTLVVEKLPIQMVADSLRVGGRGDARWALLAFESRVRQGGGARVEEVAALEAKLAALAARERDIQDSLNTQQTQLDMLTQTAQSAGASLSQQLSQAKAKISDWNQLFEFMFKRQVEARDAIKRLDRAKQQLLREREALQLQIQRLKSFKVAQHLEVPVMVDVQKAGEVVLELDYVMPDAGWEPAYDARLNASTGRLEWRYQARVRQATGEDWNSVQLRLSTAHPGGGTQAPALIPWFVVPVVPNVQRLSAKAVRRMEAADEVAEYAAPPSASNAGIVAAEATVVDQGQSVTMEAAAPVSIPSDGTPHQTPIGHAHWPVKTAYRVIPKLSTDAFLEVNTTNTGQWPILAGQVKGFVGLDYVGTTQLGTDVMPGELLQLPLGADRSIVVKRERTLKQSGETGLLTKTAFTRYQYRVTVTNAKNRAQTVTLVEPLPQVTDARITVTLDTPSHPPEPSNEVGQVAWQWQLKPHEKRVLTWGYTVNRPPDLRLMGLE
jgi:uncharacterized protein (TIGR02231 family)